MAIKDRSPQYPGRIKLTPVTGVANTYDMELADGATTGTYNGRILDPGTPLNKNTLDQMKEDILTGIATNPLLKGPKGDKGDIGNPGSVVANTGIYLGQYDVTFRGNDSGDLVWLDGQGFETDRIWAPAGDRTSLYYRRFGEKTGALMYTSDVNNSRIGFMIREANISGDGTVTVYASSFGLNTITGIVAMTRKTTVAGYPGILITWKNSDTNWTIACDRDSCNGFYAIAWGK